MKTNNKAGSVVATEPGSEPKTFLIAGGNQKRFDVSDYAEISEIFQCQKCHPSLVKPRGELRLCEDCRAETEKTVNALLDNFARHRKVIKLDCFCFCCEKRKTAGMMAKLFPVCLKCFDELKSKGATARRNFINRATNNFLKNLKKAAVAI